MGNVRYLITGSAGFIGSHLSRFLVERGDHVTGLDLRPSPSWTTGIVGSVTDSRLVSTLVKDHDAVFHLAAVVGFANVMREPLRTLHTSSMGTGVVLKACHQHGKRILFTSTSAVYGRTTDSQQPVAETASVQLGPTGTRSWCYAYGKAAEECLAFAYHQTKGLPVIVARLFNTVGPGQSAPAGFVIPRLVEAAVQGWPLTVHAPGTQSRTFAHVADVAEGLANLMECDKAVGEIVNLGGTATITMYDLADRIRTLLESASPIEVVPDPYGAGYENVAHRVPDLTKAQGLIGYRPTRSLDTIITDTLAAMEVPA